MNTDERTHALANELRRFRANGAGEPAAKPVSTYEAVTRQMVEHLQDDLREIKGRLNGLLWMVAGTLLVDVVSRLIGAG